MNLGKFRLTCHDCAETCYIAYLCAEKNPVCTECERKRAKMEERCRKRRERIIEKTDANYFKEAEMFGDDMVKLSQQS